MQARNSLLWIKRLSLPLIEYETTQLSDSFDFDILNKIDNFMSVDDLIKFYCDKTLNMPDKNFNTVFYILLDQSRFLDFWNWQNLSSSIKKHLTGNMNV